MPVNILMPALSPTMEKGNLARWLKKEGDKVKPGDVIAEIETDKATMEYEAIDEGTLAKIVVPEGTQDVPVNQLIAVLAEEGEDVKTAAASAGRAAPRPKAPAAAPPPSATGDQDGSAKPAAAPPAAQSEKAATPTPTPAPPPQAGPGQADADRTGGARAGANRIFASPLARRLAREAGIELS